MSIPLFSPMEAVATSVLAVAQGEADGGMVAKGGTVAQAVDAAQAVTSSSPSWAFWLALGLALLLLTIAGILAFWPLRRWWWRRKLRAAVEDRDPGAVGDILSASGVALEGVLARALHEWTGGLRPGEEQAFFQPALIVVAGRSTPMSAGTFALVRQAFQRGDPAARLLAVSALSRPHAEGPVKSLLADALRDSEPTVRLEGARVFARLDAREAVPKLIEGLADPEPEVRRGILGIMRTLEDIRTLDPIIQALGDEDVETAKEAARVLRSLSEQFPGRKLDALADAQGNPEALGQAGDPRALPALLRMLGDEEAGPAAAWALGRLKLRAAVLPLVRRYWDAPAYERAMIALALFEIGDARGEPVLSHARSDPSLAESFRAKLYRQPDNFQG